MTQRFTGWSGVLLLAGLCAVVGVIVSAYLPFRFEQAVVRFLTGATMPTTSLELGKSVYHGTAAALGALAGLSAGAALHRARFYLWLAGASWMCVLLVFAERYFPVHLAWLMFPFGHMGIIALAHVVAGRLLPADAAPRTSIRSAARRPGIWCIAAAMFAGLPCTIAFPFAGIAFGPMPRLLVWLVTASPAPIFGAALWTVFAAIYSALAFVSAAPVAQFWRRLSPFERAIMVVIALASLGISGIMFPVRTF